MKISHLHIEIALKQQAQNEKEVKQTVKKGYNYKYNGKEWQDELGLNTYAYGWRDYDPALARWNVIDPLAAKYYFLSSYVYAGNNPVIFVDVDGRYYDKKNNNESKRKQKRIKRKGSRLLKRAERLRRKGKDATDLVKRAKQLRKSYDDITRMRDDEDVEYRYKKFNKKNAKKFNIKGPAAIPTGTNPKGDPVVTMFVESNMGSFIHESRHGGQYKEGRLKFNKTGGYRAVHEVDAYQAQYAWNGTLTYYTYPTNEELVKVATNLSNATRPGKQVIKNNIEFITKDIINSMVDPDFELIYPPKGISLEIWNR